MDEGKQKTNREVIEELHDKAEIRKTDIRPFKQAFEGKAQMAKLPPNAERVEDRMKTEINALIAIFIEEIWLKTLEKIKQHPPGLARTTGYFRPLEINFMLESMQNSEQVANYLIFSSKVFLRKQLSEWYKIREQKFQSGIGWGGDDGSDFKDRAYDRYRKLLMIEDEKEPYMQISSGILTAVNTMWGIIKVLPKVYEKQFKTKMPIDKFEKLAYNSLHLIYALAGSHLGMFIGIEKEYVKSGILLFDSSAANDFDQNKFDFKTKGEDLFLELKSKFLGGMQPIRTKDDTRTGCPAIYSIGPSHRNVIAEMSDWIIDLTKKYYLPALQKEQK